VRYVELVVVVVDIDIGVILRCSVCLLLLFFMVAKNQQRNE
jgi:hypothetical protein